ncbi:Oidioi.mRNA.OKI2018_I69.chr2.g4467.t1.cds [Oikopleura dioica]|uniref:Oidioi.mRNA.OKI2018_I69.chr2.g4467.t1.cds n=1 Tax=Oikopleura dioica TaxID=34765 RepID=A0ABN7SXE5_OIKDI|nr:Oidioi.mRNA.OKI2018_I69.chr2.g4467.t1.cds [Oikopleura dioica]
MTKDLFHFNLCGTDGYKARLEAIMEANERIRSEVERRTAGTNFKKTTADTKTHAGVSAIASRFAGARRASAAVVSSVGGLGRRMSRALFKRQNTVG